MRKFKDLKIAIAIKIIVVALLMFYVRHNRSHVSISEVNQHLTR